eukprot:jgi/Botrbrau1/15895/Bobra.40_1s0077.2
MRTSRDPMFFLRCSSLPPHPVLRPGEGRSRVPDLPRGRSEHTSCFHLLSPTKNRNHMIRLRKDIPMERLLQRPHSSTSHCGLGTMTQAGGWSASSRRAGPVTVSPRGEGRVPWEARRESVWGALSGTSPNLQHVRQACNQCSSPRAPTTREALSADVTQPRASASSPATREALSADVTQHRTSASSVIDPYSNLATNVSNHEASASGVSNPRADAADLVGPARAGPMADGLLGVGPSGAGPLVEGHHEGCPTWAGHLTHRQLESGPERAGPFAEGLPEVGPAGAGPVTPWEHAVPASSHVPAQGNCGQGPAGASHMAVPPNPAKPAKCGLPTREGSVRESVLQATGFGLKDPAGGGLFGTSQQSTPCPAARGTTGAPKAPNLHRFFRRPLPREPGGADGMPTHPWGIPLLPPPPSSISPAPPVAVYRMVGPAPSTTAPLCLVSGGTSHASPGGTSEGPSGGTITELSGSNGLPGTVDANTSGGSHGDTQWGARSRPPPRWRPRACGSGALAPGVPILSSRPALLTSWSVTGSSSFPSTAPFGTRAGDPAGARREIAAGAGGTTGGTSRPLPTSDTRQGSGSGAFSAAAPAGGMHPTGSTHRAGGMHQTGGTHDAAPAPAAPTPNQGRKKRARSPTGGEADAGVNAVAPPPTVPTAKGRKSQSRHLKDAPTQSKTVGGDARRRGKSSVSTQEPVPTGGIKRCGSEQGSSLDAGGRPMEAVQHGTVPQIGGSAGASDEGSAARIRKGGGRMARTVSAEDGSGTGGTGSAAGVGRKRQRKAAPDEQRGDADDEQIAPKTAKRRKEKPALRAQGFQGLELVTNMLAALAQTDGVQVLDQPPDLSNAGVTCTALVLLDSATSSYLCSSLRPFDKAARQGIVKAAKTQAKHNVSQGNVPGGTSSDAVLQPVDVDIPYGQALGSEEAASQSVEELYRNSLPVALAVMADVHVQSGGDPPAQEQVYILPLASQCAADPRLPPEATLPPPSVEISQMARRLLDQVTGGGRTVCFDMQGVLRHLKEAVQWSPNLAVVQMVDPKLLAWLWEPQLLYRDEKILSSYNLQELAQRHMIQLPAVEGVPSNVAAFAQQLVADLRGACQLADTLLRWLPQRVPEKSIQREMQVAAILADMEGVGIGFDPGLLRGHEAWIKARIDQLQEAAREVVGHEINLASSAQLAVALYQTLGLPPPNPRARAGKAATTHLPTDEAALQQLRALHPLPDLVLQYRQLRGILSSWIEPAWSRYPDTGGGISQETSGPRIRCFWNQTATATGRLSASHPNLQAVTKYVVRGPNDTHVVSIRDAFVAAPGCVLLCADYSQIELRLVAHLSRDPALLEVLARAGLEGDAFSLLASRWLHKASPGGLVTPEERALAKRVTYGIIYGQTAFGLKAGLDVSQAEARDLIADFLASFHGVAEWIEEVKEAARRNGGVETLAGRHRPLPGMLSSNVKERREAERHRRAVNSIVQGSAADLLKIAMVDFAAWPRTELDSPGSVAMVAQIHDELLFEVKTATGLHNLRVVSNKVRSVMEGSMPLRVPLMVNLEVGHRWGSLEPLATYLQDCDGAGSVDGAANRNSS